MCPRTVREAVAERALRDGAAVYQQLLAGFVPSVVQVANVVVETLERGGRLYFMGNGGSAAQAQHIAAEFVGRFLGEREPLPAIALTTDTSALTGISNDYGFVRVFARQVEALVHAGDALVGLSSSGNSPNVVEAMKAASAKGAVTIAFTGSAPSTMGQLADLTVAAPSAVTPRVQEAHLILWHVVCELVDDVLTRTDAATAGPR